MQKLIDDFFEKNQNYTITTAANDCENITANWVLNESLIPYLTLNLDPVPNYLAMLNEARALDHMFVQHRGNNSHGWSSLCIHGITSQHTDHYQVYPEYAHLTNDQVPYTWTEISNFCPSTVEYFKKYFPYNHYHRIRFMKLDPGGWIIPHNDSPNKNLIAINFSLNNPDNCNMCMENIGLIPFDNRGSAIMLAIGNNHSVRNYSNEPRYHLIVHGYSTDDYTNRFHELIIKSYKSLTPKIVRI